MMQADKKATGRLSAILCILLCLAGIAVSVDLAMLHYRVHTDPHFNSFCNLGSSFNCETVAESPYSVFIGLPVAIWGMVGYLLMLGAVLWAGLFRKSPAAWVWLFCLSLASSVCSLALALVSYCIICSFCLLCTVTYVINLLLLGLSFWEIRKNRISFKSSLYELGSLLSAKWWLFLVGLLVIVSLNLKYPRYWATSIRKADVSGDQGFTADGHPWIGALNPQLVITEYSDYFCPHCKRGHANIRMLVSENPGVFQVIHRHYPLDNECNPLVTTPFHVGACLLARAAYCGGRQQKFWDINDVLYQYDTLVGEDWPARAHDAAVITKLDLAAFTECLNSPAAVDAVKRDVEAGAALNLRGTPAYVVNGKLYLGELPTDLMDQARNKP